VFAVFRLQRNALVRDVIAPALFICLIAVAGLFLGTYPQYLLALLVVNCVVGAALVMIVGYSRVIMLATGAMMAVGAYCSTILTASLGMNYLLTLPFAVLTGLVAGIVLAVPSTRFRGHHLAMVTMMFQFLVITVIREWPSLTGGPSGLRVPAPVIFGYPVASDIVALVLIAVLGAPALMVLGVLLSGHFGKTLRAISASEVGAEAYGVNISRYQIVAFAVSSGVLSFAGALMAPRVRILDPESFGLMKSVITLSYPIVGGMQSIWGGVIGGTVLHALPEALRFVGKYQELLVAGLVIIVMILFPGGLLGLFSSRRKRSKGPVQVSAVPASVRPEVRPGAELIPLNPSRASAIEIDGLTKRYSGVTAVDRVSLRVPVGTIHGIIGPNGAGKTTLFNAVSGFIPVDEGAIRIFGEPMNGLRARDRIAHGVTRTFQHVAVFGGLTCLENVMFGRGRNGIAQSMNASLAEMLNTRSFRDAIDEARTALEEVGIGDLWLKPARSLSLGDQRRLEIARAIVSRPRLILLDEPVSGIAEEEEHRTAELLLKLNREHNSTMLLVEHNIGFVRRLCKMVTVMATGRVIAEGQANEVMERPEVRREYFGELISGAA
jgi:ABC-type branched-subunit amino acid transport system ATPase component/ABC-type branched-subunit amino acid transport system permease subunit